MLNISHYCIESSEISYFIIPSPFIKEETKKLSDLCQFINGKVEDPSINAKSVVLLVNSLSLTSDTPLPRSKAKALLIRSKK